jgi:hypothetical protein
LHGQTRRSAKPSFGGTAAHDGATISFAAHVLSEALRRWKKSQRSSVFVIEGFAAEHELTIGRADANFASSVAALASSDASETPSIAFKAATSHTFDSATHTSSQLCPLLVAVNHDVSCVATALPSVSDKSPPATPAEGFAPLLGQKNAPPWVSPCFNNARNVIVPAPAAGARNWKRSS